MNISLLPVSVVLLSCLAASAAHGQIKKCVLANGKTVYQDAPCETGTQKPVSIAPPSMGNEPVVGLPINAAANSQWGAPEKTYSVQTERGKSEVWEYSDGRKLAFINGRVSEVFRPSVVAASAPSR